MGSTVQRTFPGSSQPSIVKVARRTSVWPSGLAALVRDGPRPLAEVDLLRYLVSGEHSLDSPVGALAESDYATVSPRTSIENLQGLLNDARMAIVTEEQKIVGVVTKIDLIDFLARRTS